MNETKWPANMFETLLVRPRRFALACCQSIWSTPLIGVYSCSSMDWGDAGFRFYLRWTCMVLVSGSSVMFFVSLLLGFFLSCDVQESFAMWIMVETNKIRKRAKSSPATLPELFQNFIRPRRSFPHNRLSSRQPNWRWRNDWSIIIRSITTACANHL